jgi:ADP-ribosylglycohydrolase
MRVSPVGFACDTLDDVMQQAERTAAATHNHPEGIRGAQATAVAIYLARTGSDKLAIRQHLEQQTLGFLDGRLRQVVDEFNHRFKIRKRGGTD